MDNIPQYFVSMEDLQEEMVYWELQYPPWGQQQHRL